jgi:Beta-ketoacyl synthase, N-terminal domain
MAGVALDAVGVVTGWGEGLAALPGDAEAAGGGRASLTIDRPRLDGERFRRATRECLLGVAAVRAMLASCGHSPREIAGDATALLYVTASAYGASNRAFVEAAPAAGTLHFPYTAPSAVPAEVAIEFGLTGPYAIYVGGATATLEALLDAARLVARGECGRALVLAVETFGECEDLFARARWLLGRPLVESAACALLGAGDGRLRPTSGAEPAALTLGARRRAGQTLACEPLIALALGRESGDDRLHVTGEWRGRRLGIEWTSPHPASSTNGAQV